MKFLEKILEISWCPYLFILFVSFIVYLPSMTGEFILDDIPLVQKNPFIREVQPMISYLAQEDGVIEGVDRDPWHTGYYRPLVQVTYLMDYKAWGLNPRGFRLTNLIFHILTCFLAFRLILMLLGEAGAALWAALLFALHPLHTETVSWIISRNNVLVTLFSLASFYLYVKGWEEWRRWPRVLSLLAFVLAVSSKEFGLMLLFVLFLYHRFLSPPKRGLRYEISSYIPYLIIVIAYVTLRKSITGSVVTPLAWDGLWKSLYFSPLLIIINLRLIFFPYGLHSFILHYPDRTGLIWFSGLGLLLILLFLWRTRKNRLLSFSVLSFSAALFPVLNIVPISSASLVSMRWLYFPMSFLMIGIGCVIKTGLRRRKQFATAVMASVLVYLACASYMLNRTLWHDEKRFFAHEVESLNNSYYASGLAERLLNERRYEKAERYFRTALEKGSVGPADYINFAFLLIETDRPEEALVHLSAAEGMRMSFETRGELYNNRAMALIKMKRTEESLGYFRKAVLYHPHEIQFWSNLGAAYGILGDYGRSIEALKEGLEMLPHDRATLRNLANTYIKIGEDEKAASILKKTEGKSK
jgi:tetratricopeptide (TPR) repeat protein